MGKTAASIICMMFFMVTINAQAKTNTHKEDHQLFERLFTDWTAAFNRKDVTGSCQLFSKSVIANYQGIPEKNYTSICDGFKKIFNMNEQRYHYSFKLHDVYRSGNLAAVRITWYLRVYEDGKLKSRTQDEGMDVFEKNEAGSWQIVNYIGYEAMGSNG